VAVDRAAVAAWLDASCRDQGVPVKVTDPLALARVCDLLGVQTAGTRAHGAGAPSTRPAVAPLQPPLRVDAAGVQAVAPGDLGAADGDVSE
jgi:hypothetical protein